MIFQEYLIVQYLPLTALGMIYYLLYAFCYVTGFAMEIPIPKSIH